jgi:hypothetical protein
MSSVAIIKRTEWILEITDNTCHSIAYSTTFIDRTGYQCLDHLKEDLCLIKQSQSPTYVCVCVCVVGGGQFTRRLVLYAGIQQPKVLCDIPFIFSTESIFTICPD